MELFREKFELFIDVMRQPIWQKYLWIGLENTVKIAVLGLLIGIVIGTLIAVVKVAPKYKRVMRVLDKICSVYVAIFRGTPMVVQLLLAYYCILPALGISGVEPKTVGIAVFGMNSGAYVSEIMRGGIGAVDGGQLEAARALGLSYPIAMLKVVVPQAIKNVIPTIGNEFITLIKETSVLSFVTVYDVYTMFDSMVNRFGDPLVPYLAMALIYIVLVLIITFFIKIVENILAKSDRNRKQKGGKAKA